MDVHDPVETRTAGFQKTGLVEWPNSNATYGHEGKYNGMKYLHMGIDQTSVGRPVIRRPDDR